jgi:hypothetical protein
MIFTKTVKSVANGFHGSIHIVNLANSMPIQFITETVHRTNHGTVGETVYQKIITMFEIMSPF